MKDEKHQTVPKGRMEPPETVKEIMERHFRKTIQDEDVIHTLVHLRRLHKNDQLTGMLAELYEELAVKGKV